jgi:hypothetical protein
MELTRLGPVPAAVFGALAFVAAGTLWFVALRRDRKLFQLVEEARLHQTKLAEELLHRVQHWEETQNEELARMRKLFSSRELRAPAPAADATPKPSGLDKKHYVVSLAQRGLGPMDISRRLKIYRGETELVLGLNKRFPTPGLRHERHSV